MKLNTITVVTKIQSCSLFNNHLTESHFTFIADCCNTSLNQELLFQVATKHHLLLFCFSMSLKLGDKSAAVPNVDHDSLHARVLGQLPVKKKCYQYAQACDVKVLSICTSKIVLIFGIIDFKFKTHLFNFLKAAVSELWSSSVIYYNL